MSQIKVDYKLVKNTYDAGSFNRKLQWNEFSIVYGEAKPKLAILDNPIIMNMTVLLIVLFALGISIIAAVIMLIIFVPVAARHAEMNKKSLHEKQRVYKNSLRGEMPGPPERPKDIRWQYWIWMGFFISMPFLVKGNGFSADNFFQIISVAIGIIGFPLAWKKAKVWFDIKRSIEMQAYKQSIENWHNMIMCKECGHIHINTDKQ